MALTTFTQQRIQGYAEADQATLNEDQKRAIASKPVLEATVKELQDVVKLLEVTYLSILLEITMLTTLRTS